MHGPPAGRAALSAFPETPVPWNPRGLFSKLFSIISFSGHLRISLSLFNVLSLVPMSTIIGNLFKCVFAVLFVAHIRYN